MENISIQNDGKLHITNDAVIYFQTKFVSFNIEKFFIDVETNIAFDIKLSYAYDNQNWSSPVSQEEWINIDNYLSDISNDLDYIYLSIWCSTINNNINLANEFRPVNNIDNTIPALIINSISYDEIIVKDYLIKNYYSIVNEFPKWNLYDNQENNVKRWLQTCNSTAYSHGHVCIYFKTQPVDTGTIHTFSNHSIRNVVSIKKLMIMDPNNELPSESLIYSDWDMPLEDDFVIHVINDLFQQAFGINQAPNTKDYLFFPLINKLFRVSTVQPARKRFMGKIGWWECYLAKYEEDETVTISNDLRQSMSHFDGVSESLEEFNIIEELEKFTADTVLTGEKIRENTIDEKNIATEHYTNKLVDSTSYIDLKETDNQRKFISKRLQIISVNPDDNAFPVTMYDCRTIDTRVVALTYDLKDCVSINKHTLIVNDNFSLSFNYISLAKFAGEVLDIIGGITIASKRTKYFEIICPRFQTTTLIDYKFEDNEFYHITVDYKESLKQLAVKIFKLKNKQKNLEYQNIYILNNTDSVPHKMSFSEMFLYGGNYLINEVILKINNNPILSDQVNPVLQMFKFGN